MFRLPQTLPLLRPQPLRTLRPLRLYYPLSSLTRRSILGRNGLVNVQHVRIKHTIPVKRLLATVVWPITYFLTASAVVVVFLADDEDDDEEEVEEKKTDHQTTSAAKKAKEGDTVFLPLGFAYKLPRKFYKGTDPEWQSFIQLSNDKTLCNSLKNQLTGMVGQTVGSLPVFQKVLGADIKPRKFWIDIDFPDGPPPEYERRGLEFADDHISWTTRPVDPLHYAKLQKALWPDSLASSFWASSKTMTSLQYAKLKRVLDFTSSTEASDSEDSETPDLKLQKLSQQPNRQTQKSAPGSDNDMPAGSPTLNNTQRQSSTKHGPSDLSKLLPVMPNLPVVGDDTASALKAFKKKFERTWQPANAPPERGTAIFSGMIELVGPKGVAVMDVRAAYHVAESRWTQIAVATRRVQARQQGPKGGS
ncbi:MAG: hypothetical protein Q9170_006365 [Blastenia crenularia]